MDVLEELDTLKKNKKKNVSSFRVVRPCDDVKDVLFIILSLRKVLHI